MTGGEKENELQMIYKWFHTPVTYGGHVFALKRRMKMNLFVISFVILVAPYSLLQVNGGKLKLVTLCFVWLFSVYILYWFPLFLD